MSDLGSNPDISTEEARIQARLDGKLHPFTDDEGRVLADQSDLKPGEVRKAGSVLDDPTGTDQAEASAQWKHGLGAAALCPTDESDEMFQFDCLCGWKSDVASYEEAKREFNQHLSEAIAADRALLVEKVKENWVPRAYANWHAKELMGLAEEVCETKDKDLILFNDSRKFLLHHRLRGFGRAQTDLSVYLREMEEAEEELGITGDGREELRREFAEEILTRLVSHNEYGECRTAPDLVDRIRREFPDLADFPPRPGSTK